MEKKKSGGEKSGLGRIFMDMLRDMQKSKRPLSDREMLSLLKIEHPNLSRQQIADMYGLSI